MHERQIVAGWLIYRNLKQLSTTTTDLKQFLDLNFAVHPKSPSWINDFLSKSHLSLRNTSIQRWSERSPSKYAEAVDYINDIRYTIRHQLIPVSKIAVMDKTKFRRFSQGVKHIGIKGGHVDIFFHVAFYVFH